MRIANLNISLSGLIRSTASKFLNPVTLNQADNDCYVSSVGNKRAFAKRVLYATYEKSRDAVDRIARRLAPECIMPSNVNEKLKRQVINISEIQALRGEIIIDDTPLRAYPGGTLFKKGEAYLVKANNKDSLITQDEVNRLCRLTGSSRVNIISDNLSDVALNLTECANNTFSWLVILAEAQDYQQRQTVDGKSQVKYEELDILPEDIKMKLIEAWDRDYINSTLADYPENIRQAHQQLFAKRLEGGNHILFFEDGQLIGHGCFSEVTHPVLEKVTALQTPSPFSLQDFEINFVRQKFFDLIC